jgi:hypothetical protein
MAYDRYLDIHFFKSFTTATFARDTEAQREHQVSKVGKDGYKIMELPGITIRRGVANDSYGDLIAWVCGGSAGKIRINAHGDGAELDDGRSAVELGELAAFLQKNGLTPEKKGGLKTVNMACCHAADGPEDKWIIKALADMLKLPGVQFTGAPGRTRMEDGILKVGIPKKPTSGAYVPPAKWPLVSESFKHHATHKKTYTYQQQS